MKVSINHHKTPINGPIVVAVITLLSIGAALAVGGALLLPFEVSPFDAYLRLFEAGFASWKGLGFTLVKAAPLILTALATICAWRTGFVFLGYEGCLLIGAVTTTAIALATAADGAIGPVPFVIFLPLALFLAALAGGIWAGIVAFLKTRFGGNEVIISLMMNYIAILLVQYIVSGLLRAPGDQPLTPRLPRDTWLPILVDGTRAHAGILIAIVAAFLVWIVLLKSRIGYELIVTGLNPRAARYGGINVGSRQVLAAFLAGGLAGLAGLVDILGLHHRMTDGMSEGTGFIGIVTALLGKLNPFGAVASSFLYSGMSVGADTMQRQVGLPTSLILIVQSLIVLFILASDVLRYWSITLTFHTNKPRIGPLQGRNADARAD